MTHPDSAGAAMPAVSIVVSARRKKRLVIKIPPLVSAPILSTVENRVNPFRCAASPVKVQACLSPRRPFPFS